MSVFYYKCNNGLTDVTGSDTQQTWLARTHTAKWG